jgi:predicted nucleotidyltransferase
LSSAEVRYLKTNFDELLRRLREYAKSKAGTFGAKAVVLVGSMAKGNYTGTSDADVLIIADQVPKRVIDRYALFAEPRLPFDLEPHVYTTAEFITKVQQGDRFALDSLQFGIPLEGEEFFKQLKKSIQASDPH